MTRRTTFQVLGIWILFCASILQWIWVDTCPPLWDESVHFNLAFDYRAWLFHGEPVTSSWASIYPPLYHFSLIPALAFINSPAAAAATHLVYVFIFLWAMVSLAESFDRTAEIGLLAALLTLGAAYTEYLGRRAYIDFSVICWVSAGMALLWRTDGFKRLNATLLWGLWSGFGMLLKPYYPIYFVLPCALILKQGFSSAQPGERPVRNALAALGVIMVFSLPWYGWRGAYFFTHAFSMVTESGADRGLPSFTTLAGWLYYIRQMPAQWGWPSLAVLLAGLALLVLRWKDVRGKRFLWAWFFSGYLAWTIMRTKGVRFTVGYLPALALLAVMGGVSSKASAWQKRGLWALLIALLIANCVLYDRPLPQNWQHQTIGRLMIARRDASQPFLIASVLSNHPCFFGRNLRWSVRAMGQPITMQSSGNPDADFVEFVIAKTGNLGPDAGDIEREWQTQRASGRIFAEVYPHLQDIPLAEGSQAQIYRRDPNVHFQVDPISQASLERRLTSALKNGLIDGPVSVKISGSPSGWPNGRIERAEVSGSNWVIRGLPIARAHLTLNQVWLNLYRVWDQNKPGLLALGSLAPEVEVKAADIEALVKQRVRGADQVHVEFNGGKVVARMDLKGWPVYARARLELLDSPRQLAVTIESIKVHGIPISPWFLGAMRVQEVPLDPIPSFPVALQIQDVKLENGLLRVN